MQGPITWITMAEYNLVGSSDPQETDLKDYKGEMDGDSPPKSKVSFTSFVCTRAWKKKDQSLPIAAQVIKPDLLCPGLAFTHGHDPYM